MRIQTLIRTVAALGAVALAGTAQAVTLDLQAAGSNGMINGAYFTTTSQQTTGTGVIAPFLRLQKSPTEQGYNTSGNPPYSDVKTGIWTHNLLLVDVPVVTIGGIQYREFLLDINETGNDPQISLEQLKIAVGSTVSPTTAWGTFGTQVFNLDALSDSKILLNYNLNSGSGSGDMFAYIPNSLFTGQQYVYFYSQFGLADSAFDSEAGFEEWAVRKVTTSVPEPATLGLLGLGLAGVGFARRRKLAA